MPTSIKDAIKMFEDKRSTEEKKVIAAEAEKVNLF